MSGRGEGPVAALARFVAFVRAGYLDMLAYRMEFYVGVLNYVLFVGVYYFVWKGVYAARGSDLPGYTLARMVTYLAVGWIVRSTYFNNVDWDMAEEIAEGGAGADLLKPMDYQAMRYGRALGETLFRLTIFTPLAGGAIAVLYGVRAPASWGALVPMGVSLATAFVVMTSLNFAIGTLAIYTGSVHGIIRMKQQVLQLLSGLLVPLDLVPEPWGGALRVLPFASLTHVPAQIYLGALQGEAMWRALALQGAWAVALVWGAAFLWRRAVRRISIHGG